MTKKATHDELICNRSSARRASYPKADSRRGCHLAWKVPISIHLLLTLFFFSLSPQQGLLNAKTSKIAPSTLRTPNIRIAAFLLSKHSKPHSLARASDRGKEKCREDLVLENRTEICEVRRTERREHENLRVLDLDQKIRTTHACNIHQVVRASLFCSFGSLVKKGR